MSEIVVVGGGGHAKVIINILKKLPEFTVIGYTDILDKGSVLSIPYLGDDTVLGDVLQRRGRCSAVIGIGYLRPSNQRNELAEQLLKLGFELPTVISSRAIVNEQVHIGNGSIVMDGTVINPGAEIGSYAIINTNSTIEHDAKIGDHVHIGPGAIICGGAAVSDYSFIGAGATVIHNITIGKRCIIGAGSTVTNTIDRPGTYAGSPARKVS